MQLGDAGRAFELVHVLVVRRGSNQQRKIPAVLLGIKTHRLVAPLNV